MGLYDGVHADQDLTHLRTRQVSRILDSAKFLEHSDESPALGLVRVKKGPRRRVPGTLGAKLITVKPGNESAKVREAQQPLLVTVERAPCRRGTGHVGVRGVAPRKASRPTVQVPNGHQTACAGSWARRDLNPHVLSDTRT
jgi:hypothetical protein